MSENSEEFGLTAKMKEEIALWVHATGLDYEQLLALPLPPHKVEGQKLLVHKDHMVSNPLFYAVHKIFLADATEVLQPLCSFADTTKPEWKEVIVRPVNAYVRCELEPKVVPVAHRFYLAKPWHRDSDAHAERLCRPFVLQEDGKFGYQVDGIELELLSGPAQSFHLGNLSVLSDGSCQEYNLQ